MPLSCRNARWRAPEWPSSEPLLTAVPRPFWCASGTASGLLALAVERDLFVPKQQDRFLDEARETADPVRLMCLFGISSHIAIRYARAADPEHFTVTLPRHERPLLIPLRSCSRP
jgi:hypothetical protein